MTLPTPKLYQINFYYTRPDFPHEENVASILQLAADDHDLENAIGFLSEEYQNLQRVEKAEITIGFSPLFHDLFIEGGKAIKYFDSPN